MSGSKATSKFTNSSKPNHLAGDRGRERRDLLDVPLCPKGRSCQELGRCPKFHEGVDCLKFFKGERCLKGAQRCLHRIVLPQSSTKTSTRLNHDNTTHNTSTFSFPSNRYDNNGDNTMENNRHWNSGTNRSEHRRAVGTRHQSGNNTDNTGNNTSPVGNSSTYHALEKNKASIPTKDHGAERRETIGGHKIQFPPVNKEVLATSNSQKHPPLESDSASSLQTQPQQIQLKTSASRDKLKSSHYDHNHKEKSSGHSSSKERSRDGSHKGMRTKRPREPDVSASFNDLPERETKISRREEKQDNPTTTPTLQNPTITPTLPTKKETQHSQETQIPPIQPEQSQSPLKRESLNKEDPISESGHRNRKRSYEKREKDSLLSLKEEKSHRSSKHHSSRRGSKDDKLKPLSKPSPKETVGKEQTDFKESEVATKDASKQESSKSTHSSSRDKRQQDKEDKLKLHSKESVEEKPKEIKLQESKEKSVKKTKEDTSSESRKEAKGSKEKETRPKETPVERTRKSNMKAEPQEKKRR